MEQIVRRADAGEPVAVCTVVRTRGSTPQKAGAVMLVLRDGQTIGTIGGGCVEADVRSRALQSLSGGATVSLFTFKLDDEITGWDDGLVCGGTMDVAVQVVDSPARAGEFRAARDALAAGNPADLVVIVAGAERFERRIEPIPSLVIVGAGHVGSALAVVARQMDFDVTVLDDRPDYASPDRFPPGVTCRVGDTVQQLARLPINLSTYIVIVTRGHRNDGRALAAVVATPAKYLGVIGSKRKILAIYADLLSRGVLPDALARVHAPIGLNVGAITPGEIAVSIAAELIAVRRGAPLPAGAMRLTPQQLERAADQKE